MNPIDAMLLSHANKIEIRTFPNPNVFEVVFSSFPGDDMLFPLVELIKTDRFRWSALTVEEILQQSLNKLLSFKIQAINLIPVSDAISALAQMWRDAGYTVTIDGQPEQAQDEPQDEPQESIAER